MPLADISATVENTIRVRYGPMFAGSMATTSKRRMVLNATTANNNNPGTTITPGHTLARWLAPVRRPTRLTSQRLREQLALN